MKKPPLTRLFDMLLGRHKKRGRASSILLSARDDADGNHYAVGFHLDGSEAFSTQVPLRCHAIIEHPTEPVALYFARRPGRESYLIDLVSGELLQTIASEPYRHFYGHGVFHASGNHLYATENDTSDPGRGLLGVYRYENRRLTREGEISTHGLGPHEVCWMPDGETLVVANGGIRTEAESRIEMNLDAMEPSLVLMRRDGALVSKETLSQTMNSIRHLDVAADGTIAACQQYMGNSEDVAPLLALKRPGEAFAPFPIAEEQRRTMGQYTASVAIHGELRLVALTAPRGNRFFIWDMDSHALKLDVHMPDCAGVGAVDDGFVVTSGQGRCRFYDCRQENLTSQPLQLPTGWWDNHLRLIAH
ncbi:lipoprotein [Pseudomonas matsuisoli]|uniref:Lipoprotein n=2 Tax=Pseudomonas matsuisoli TaxID=1515666 RepID=A0A917PLG5_9PSED|nr:lipoprotein [Pseudomonas matsuisoli]